MLIFFMIIRNVSAFRIPITAQHGGDTCSSNLLLWATCQMRKIAGGACAGNAGNVFPATTGLAILACVRALACPLSDKKQWASCPIAVTYVPWCIPGSLTRGGRENVPGFPEHAQPPQFYVSSKMPMDRTEPFIQQGTYIGCRASTAFVLNLWQLWDIPDSAPKHLTHLIMCAPYTCSVRQGQHCDDL